jgi:hypothetical protein
MPPTKRKRSISSDKKEIISIQQAFLQQLSVDEAKSWLQEVIKHDGCTDLINHRHFKSILTFDEFKSSTSIGPFNGENFFIFLKILNIILNLGAYFEKWMQCKIKEKYLLNPPHTYPQILVYKNGTLWPQYKKIFQVSLHKIPSNECRYMPIT